MDYTQSNDSLALFCPAPEVCDQNVLPAPEKCDKTGYLIASFCGAMAGLIDVLFVQAPNEGPLQTVVDKKTDDLVVKASQFFWKHDKRTTGKSKKMPDTLEKCVSYLEQAFPVPYDARFAKDLNVKDGKLAGMNPKNHHLLSLAHSPDPIGLVFSIIDQFTNTASFIDKGKVIHAEPLKKSGAIPYMVGTDLPSKLFCGFLNWIGHILSDMVGSSSTRKEGKDARGMGVAIPFSELFLKCNFGPEDGATFAETMIKVYEEGYDLRFGATMAIPVVLEELMVRAIWIIRQKFERKKPWKECLPTAKHEDLRVMLLVSNGVFFAIDGIDAIIHGVSSHSMVNAVCHLNLVGLSRLAMLGIKEIAIRLKIKLFENEEYPAVLGKMDEREKKWLAQMVKQLQGSMTLIGVFQQVKTAIIDETTTRQERVVLEAKLQGVVLELQQNREEFALAFDAQMEKYYLQIDFGFSSMEEGLAAGDADSVIRGNTMIQQVLGKTSQFNDSTEFDALMDSNEDFKL